MLTNGVAPKYTQITPGQAITLESGETIRVYGIVVGGQSGTVTLSDAAGNTIVAIPSGGNVPFEIKTGFIAYKGLKVTTSASIYCTVFHSKGSA